MLSIPSTATPVVNLKCTLPLLMWLKASCILAHIKRHILYTFSQKRQGKTSTSTHVGLKYSIMNPFYNMDGLELSSDLRMIIYFL